MSFVGSWCRVGAGNVVLGQWALFGGEERHFGAGGIVCSVRRSSSLDWKKDRNLTEPNCKRPDHWLGLHKF